VAQYTERIGYIIGILLALLVSFLARLAGFDRDRAFYPTLLVVIASYYVLFAVMGGATHALLVELFVMTIFLVIAFVGFKFNLWLVVAALASHGLFDFAHGRLVTNPGVPAWWPSFCLAYDVIAAGFLATLLYLQDRAKPVLELKIPPVVLGLIAALLIWLTSLTVPTFHFMLPGRFHAAAVLAFLGVAISISGVISFRRVRTTVNPTTPGCASSLVVSGVYKFTRNPMYLGFLLVLLGWTVLLSNPLGLVWILAFVLYMNRFQIRPEERALASLFKQDFLAYKTRVRRWV